MILTDYYREDYFDICECCKCGEEKQNFAEYKIKRLDDWQNGKLLFTRV